MATWKLQVFEASLDPNRPIETSLSLSLYTYIYIYIYIYFYSVQLQTSAACCCRRRRRCPRCHRRGRCRCCRRRCRCRDAAAEGAAAASPRPPELCSKCLSRGAAAPKTPRFSVMIIVSTYYYVYIIIIFDIFYYFSVYTEGCFLVRNELYRSRRPTGGSCSRWIPC